MKTRINFLDNMRTFLILLVIVLHAGIVYEPILQGTWIVSDPAKNNSLGLVRMYIDIIVMFAMFFISGYFVHFSLNNNSTWGFLKSKFKRIMLPWIVAVFTLIPLYKIIFLVSRGMLQEEWFSYFHLFQRAGGDMYFFADNPTQSWLWFLPVLFMFQIAYLALSKTGLFSIKISMKTGVILTFVLGLVYSMIISRNDLMGWHHSPLLHFQKERLLPYFLVFLLGALSGKLRVFESNTKNKKLYIISNVTLTVSLAVFTVVALNLFFNMIYPDRNFYFVSAFFDKVIYFATMLASMFSFLYVMIHVFRFNFNKTNAIMKELNKNSYAVYIIHLIVIGVVAMLLLNVSLPAIVKFLIVPLFTFVVSNLLVSAYRSVFQKFLSARVFTYAVPVAAVILIVSIYTAQANSVSEKPYSVVVQNQVSPPDVSLHMAVIQGNLEAVKQHIAAGTNLDEKEPTVASSPLITAATFGRVDIAKALIEAGADVNYQNNDGSTALHTAAFFCQKEIVEALLNSGADKTLKNKGGATAYESVAGPYESVRGIYEYFAATLGPLGLSLDYEQIKNTRPVIAEMLK